MKHISPSPRWSTSPSLSPSLTPRPRRRSPTICLPSRVRTSARPTRATTCPGCTALHCGPDLGEGLEDAFTRHARPHWPRRRPRSEACPRPSSDELRAELAKLEPVASVSPIIRPPWFFLASTTRTARSRIRHNHGGQNLGQATLLQAPRLVSLSRSASCCPWLYLAAASTAFASHLVCAVIVCRKTRVRSPATTTGIGRAQRSWRQWRLTQYTQSATLRHGRLAPSRELCLLVAWRPGAVGLLRASPSGGRADTVHRTPRPSGTRRRLRPTCWRSRGRGRSCRSSR